MVYACCPSTDLLIYILIYLIWVYFNTFPQCLIMKLLVCFKQESGTVYCFHGKHLHLQVYKSASKRKAHILKNHPGAELPPSIRKLRPAGPGEPDPMLSTHTQLTGTIATPPVCCPHCSKQYSSKVGAVSD